MENFVVSARKYRPDSFETVVGQPAITTTLINAIKTKQLAHAYLFCGPRGVGKTTCARIFAKTINCQVLGDDTEACGECESCQSFSQNRSFTIHELDAASNNSVEDIRNLTDQVRIPPQVGKYSIYIIDEVHMLSSQAFNAFLKTLEEPPAHAIFILATTEKHKIIPTILSRCQIFDFNRIKVIDIMEHLKVVSGREGVEIDSAALNIIAQKADGSMRDALSIFDQVVSFSGKVVDYKTVVANLNVLDYDYYFKITEAFLSGNYKQALLIYNEILNNGFDSHNFINGLGGHFRNLLVTKDPETIQLMELSGELADKYLEIAKMSSEAFLFAGLEIINAADIHYKQAKDSRLYVEICLLKLSTILLAPVAASVTLDSHAKSDDKPVSAAKENPAPITESTTAPEPASVKQTPTPASTPAPTQTIASSPASTPKGLRPTPRLSDFMNKQQDSNETSSEIKIEAALEPQGAILALSQENLLLLWNDFADTIKNEQPRLYNTLLSQTPVLLDKKVSVNLNNPLQAKALSSIHNELEGYLKARTGETNLLLEPIVNQAGQTERKLYTQDEKYTHLKKQNPNLDLLRQNFNLDFD
ncbi:MAG: DNA polymerase III subunit gamma/tau [Bacteroidales bacterium]|nr:DNA polymerase III subunit gamma/tau [Bacteroidales bacterium]